MPSSSATDAFDAQDSARMRASIARDKARQAVPRRETGMPHSAPVQKRGASI